MSNINYLAIITLTVVNFIVGSLWFSKFFGKTWRKIHHADHHTPEEAKASRKGMATFMLLEFFLTLVLNTVLFLFIQITVAPLTVAFILWLGFILPTTISNVIWGGDEKKYMFKKIAISSGYRLVMILITAYVYFIW